jgi:hypothetical protein
MKGAIIPGRGSQNNGFTQRKEKILASSNVVIAVGNFNELNHCIFFTSRKGLKFQLTIHLRNLCQNLTIHVSNGQ